VQEHFPQYDSGLNEPVQNVSSQMKATLSLSLAGSVVASFAHVSAGTPSMVSRGEMRTMRVETMPYIYRPRVLDLYKAIEVSKPITAIGCVTITTVVEYLSEARQRL
jgi:hypothetical protein